MTGPQDAGSTQAVSALPSHYQRAIRILIRYAIALAIVGLLVGISYQESTKKLPYADAPAGVRIESVYRLAMTHGHIFTMGVFLPLALAGALVLARKVGGRELGPGALRWLLLGYLPFAVASIALQVYKGYHFLLLARAGERDLAVIDAAVMGGSHVLRYGIWAVAHVGWGVSLGVFLVLLWRSLPGRSGR